jgi:hypothetical protein
MNKLRLIWISIFASTFLYAVIAFMVAGHSNVPFSDQVKQPIVMILYAIGISTLFAAPFIAAAVGRSNRDAGTVVILALYESIAIDGLVAAFIVHDWRLFVPAWAVAAIGFLRAYPSDDALAR